MTLEEAIDILAESKRQNEVMRDNPSTFWASHQMADGVKNTKKRIAALDFALTALRPVSRDRIEKVWSGCHECSGCKLCIWNETKKCNDCKNRNSFRPLSDFCPRCGRPLTDAAVDMVIEKLKEVISE